VDCPGAAENAHATGAIGGGTTFRRAGEGRGFKRAVVESELRNEAKFGKLSVN